MQGPLASTRAGVLWSSLLHPGISTPESLRGSLTAILPSVLPAALLQHREGFTDLSRLVDGIAPAPGNVTYPTRNFATLGPFILLLPIFF